MLMHLYKASDPYFTELVEVNTLEDLKELGKKYSCSLVIDLNSDYTDFMGPSLTIYDSSIEDSINGQIDRKGSKRVKQTDS